MVWPVPACHFPEPGISSPNQQEGTEQVQPRNQSSDQNQGGTPLRNLGKTYDAQFTTNVNNLNLT